MTTVRRKPVRIPIRVPTRTPIVSIPEESVSYSGEEFVDHIAEKIQFYPLGIEINEGIPSIVEGGLGEVFSNQEWDITDEELNERIVETVSNESADPGWDDVTWQMIQSSCAFFAQEVLRGPPEPPYLGRFWINEHHEEWDDMLHESRRICVMAPRDHGKTFFFDFAYPIWQAVLNPGKSGFIFSSTQDQAKRILSDIIEEIETNPQLEFLIPKRKDKWSANMIRLSNGHRIYARGFGTRVRGAHPCWIVVDDGLNDETAYSETVREKQINYFFTAITNMIIPGGQIVVVGTPFHNDDLYKKLAENDQYLFRRYVALNEATKEALWPERYSYESLLIRKGEIGSLRFTREFLCSPIADEMSLFPSYLFKGAPVEQFQLRLGMPQKYWDEVGIAESYMGVDFALSSNVGADFTVVFVMGVDKNGNRWIMDIKRVKGLPYHEQLSLINQLGRRYRLALILLESNQMQRIFGDELIRETDLPVQKFNTGSEKHTLDRGVPSLRILLENKKIRIPRGDKYSVEQTDKWIEEMNAITFQEGKIQSVAAHDDTVMACWLCDQAIRAGGMNFTFGDEYVTKAKEKKTSKEKSENDEIVEEVSGEREEPESEDQTQLDPELFIGGASPTASQIRGMMMGR
jgi:hypothetical protein